MTDLLRLLLLALLPAGGNFLGGLFAEFLPISRNRLSLALHAAAGVVLAIVGVEIMPQALTASPAWVVVAALFAGGVFYVLLNGLIDWLQERRSASSVDSGPWLIYLAVAVDLFSDGVMIGAGSSLDFNLGLLLALGQITADVPEGFATIATFKQRGVERVRRLLLAASLVVPVLIGAVLGYILVRGRPDIYKLGLLTFTAGVLVTLVIEEIVPESHEGEEAREAALFFIGGFALFTLLSLYLG